MKWIAQYSTEKFRVKTLIIEAENEEEAQKKAIEAIGKEVSDKFGLDFVSLEKDYNFLVKKEATKK